MKTKPRIRIGPKSRIRIYLDQSTGANLTSLIYIYLALAVGTLTGDALLHLLPHAMLAGAGLILLLGFIPITQEEAGLRIRSYLKEFSVYIKTPVDPGWKL